MTNSTRREWLRSVAALPLALRASGRPAATSRHGRSLVLVYLDGGMSHLDTFDGKPQAPPDIRGDLRSVRCALDGVFVSAHLPRLGALMNRCVLIRSLTHGEGNHDRGTAYLLTGHRPSPVLRHPSLGAVLSHHGRPTTGPLPAYVCIPDRPAHGGSGFLPLVDGPFEVEGEPHRPDFAVRDLEPRRDLGRAMRMLAELDTLDGAPRSADEAARDELLRRARVLSMDARARRAFDLRDEPAERRARYGRHRLGQSLLLARRLAERGVRTVLVRDRGWDHHVGIAKALTFGYPPKLEALDQGLSALIEDLERLGLHERVTVCLLSEFGRTPRLNPRGGRDHWPRAQSVLLYGAGLRRGVVVGETDTRGEEPRSDPHSPAELFVTLLAALGVDPETELRTPTGRPVRLAEQGAQPIREALAP